MRIQVNLKGLAKFSSEMKQVSNQEVRIGFLGDEKNSRSSGEITNADLAAIHHFGSPAKKIPVRSPFIGFMIDDKTQVLNDVIGKSLSNSIKKGSLNKGDVTQALAKGGIAGENLIDDAFQTGGFGLWPAIKDSTAKRKGNEKILIHTDQLHKARISKVVNK